MPTTAQIEATWDNERAAALSGLPARKRELVAKIGVTAVSFLSMLESALPDGIIKMEVHEDIKAALARAIKEARK